FGTDYTDEYGVFDIETLFEGETAINAFLNGRYVHVLDFNGNDALYSDAAETGTFEQIDFDNSNSSMGERNAYYHVNVLHDYVKELDGQIILPEHFPVTTNVSDYSYCDSGGPCNACASWLEAFFMDGGNMCTNMAFLNDVVYHEYGHVISRIQYTIFFPIVNKMDEAFSDYLANTMTNRREIAKGISISNPNAYLRPADAERKYPATECGDADINYYCHSEVLSGALWHMRENFIDKNGYDAGKTYADYLFHFAKYGKPNSFQNYLNEILLLDDNDGDLTNLTPNYKEICQAFGRHNINCPYASPYNCGEMKNDITLEANVSTPDDCMDITTSGITLDCAGHQIVGTDHASNGIDLYEIENATIKNCKISNFWAGIYLNDNGMFHPFFPSSLNNTITNNQLYDNNIGVAMFRTHDSYVQYNEIYDNVQYHGVYLSHSEGTEINNNKIYGNEQSGILASNDNSNLIIHDNNSFGNKASGVELMGSSSFANIYNNKTYDNWISGIQVVLDSDNHDIYNNISYNNGTNIRAYQSNDNKIYDNNVGDATVAASITVESNSQQNDIYENHIYCPNNGGGLVVRYGSIYNDVFDNNIYTADFSGIIFNQVEQNDARNNFIYGLSTESKGIRFLDSNMNVVEGGTIADNNYDVWSYNSFNTLRNVSFDKALVGFDDDESSITIEWFLDIKLENEFGIPIKNVNVTISNDFGQVFFGTTNMFGYIPTQIVKEYVHFGDGSKIYHTPHTIEAELEGFQSATEYVYMNQSKEIVIVLIDEKQPGAPCDSNEECSSGYCEGSVSNASRCCIAQPPEDGWYGGGNTFGCGIDSNSDYEDYYCNASGNEQFEVANTQNCDWQDDCTTWCVGNGVHGDLDFYVILNTNTCTSTGGELVEDCTTKTSTDTDGGDAPKLFGILTDFDSCSEGQCISSVDPYSDYCETDTKLWEHFPWNVTYDTKSYLCEDGFEEEATDDDAENNGDDPTYTKSCHAGVRAECSGGQFETENGDSGTDHCEGTCGTSENSCHFLEFYPVDSDDACPLNDTCTSKSYDADTEENTCNECKGENFWNLGGETAETTCCGDDSSEFKTIRNCEPDACISDSTDDACCISNDKCVYTSVCYDNEYSGDIDNDLKTELCNNGTWEIVTITAPQLLHPENNSIHLDADSLYFDWSDVPYADEYKLTIAHPVHGTFIFNPIESEYLLEATEWTLLKDGTYTWKVNAVVNAEEGPASEEWNFTKLTTPVQIFPYDGTTYAYRSEPVIAEWENTGAEKYKLKIILLNGMPFEQEIAGTEYVIPSNLWNILNDGTYKWSVASVVGSHNSPYSEEWHLTKDTIPVLLSPFNGAELDYAPVTFDWDDVENADFYKAKATIPGNPNPIEFQLPPDQSYFTIYEPGWNNLPNGEYTWQVKSVKGIKESNYSELWSFTKTG
ncbi:MAG: NosD domain-containing protein, partial [Candidatus Diapherotrites archaeon]